MEQAFRHLDLLQARSSQDLGSVPVDSRLALKLSLIETQQWATVGPCAGRQLCVEGGLWNPAVCHSVDMTNPAELCFDDVCCSPLLIATYEVIKYTGK